MADFKSALPVEPAEVKRREAEEKKLSKRKDIIKAKGKHISLGCNESEAN